MKLCFDLDGVICTNTFGKYEEAVSFPEMIKLINDLYNDGHQIIIQTARGMRCGLVSEAYQKYYNMTFSQLELWGLKFHELMLGKVEYDYIIDDKAIRVNSDGSDVEALRKLFKGINIVVIPARSGSKSIPNKNIKEFCGRPLMAWAIEAGLKAHNVDRVIVAVDCQEYANIAIKYGAEAFFRNPNNSDDKTHAVHAILECVNHYEKIQPINNVAMVLATNPTTLSEDVGRCFSMMDGTCDGVVSVNDFDKPISSLRFVDDSNIMMPISNDITFFETRRQDTKRTYEVNGAIFLATAAKLKKSLSFHAGKVKPYIMEKSRSVDINSPDDWKKAEVLMKYYLERQQ